MYINWNVTIRFDPNSLEPPRNTASRSRVMATTVARTILRGPLMGRPRKAATGPMPLSRKTISTLYFGNTTLFVRKDGLVPPQDIPKTIAKAEVDLVEAMHTLTETNSDPEALLYDAFATLGIVGKILTTPFEVLEAHPTDAAAVIAAAEAAIPNFEIGLAETSGAEARSLHGAFHVFEAHFADLLPFV
jgi:hypothetical protein